MAVTGLPAHALGLEAYPRLLPVGDAAVSVEFGNTIDPTINAQVAALDLAIAVSELPGIIETVPTYRSLLICYEPAELDFASLVSAVRDLVRDGQGAQADPGRHWTIPVEYGPPHGEDLEEVGRRCGLAPEEVIAAHAGVEFLVYLVGFSPGVPNLGRLPDCLNLPRRAQPRPMIPAGSVVIAGAQASIISVAMPSGWYIIGRTPVRAYQPDRPDPFLFNPGDRVRFRPIDGATYAGLAAAAAQGEMVAALGER